MQTLAEYYYNNSFVNYVTNGNLTWYACDKGTCHDYINSYYNNEFTPRRNEQLTILEIGVQFGGSIGLWNGFFPNATVYGIDIYRQIVNEYASIEQNDRIKLIWGDAYSNDIVHRFPDCYFDYIVDDGPHSLESQKLAISKWLHKVKVGGKLVIEDIQNQTELHTLLRDAWENRLTQSVKVFDTRESKGRYDDLIIEITRK